MRKVVLIGLLMTVSSSAMAEWVKLAGNAEIEIYDDPAETKILRTMNTVILKTMYNDLKNGGSIVTPQSFDCLNGRHRNLPGGAYEGHMATGKMLEETKLGDWKDGTSNLTQYACGKL